MVKQSKTVRVVLDVNFGAHSGRHEFDQKSIIIGSGPTANLKLDDPSVSSMHAILQSGKDDHTAMIVDLGSEKGICINGQEVEREGEVRRGDTIAIGEIEIRVQSVGQDEEEAVAEQPTAPPPSRTETPIAKPDRRPGAEKSGQVLFRRELARDERPQQGDRHLEVKVVWGRTALDAFQFADNEAVTIGPDPRASFQIHGEHPLPDLFTLVGPGTEAGHTIHALEGMDLDIISDGRPVDTSALPLVEGVRSYNLKLEDRVRVVAGGLAFLIQYTASAHGVRSGYAADRDFQLGKWLSTVGIVALGLYAMILVTPEWDRAFDELDYLRNPARLAQLIMPPQVKKEAKFDEIKKKEEEKLKAEDESKWKKVNTKAVEKKTDIPREVKKEQDRKIATNAGILGLLKKAGGGTGDNASTVFGGAAMTNLDASLENLNQSGMGDSGGFGGLGTRGGGFGGGAGLGLGGMGTAGYGRGDGGVGTGSLSIGHRGKNKVEIRKGRTRIVGGLSQEVVGAYINRYWSHFKYCYEKELSKNPNLYGKVTTQFTIAGNGRVSEAQVVQTSMKNSNVEECLLRTIRRIIFPTPKGGGDVIVTYPFMFTTAG